jgi:hypothetical protein
MNVLDLTTTANTTHWTVRSPIPVVVEAGEGEDDIGVSPEAHLSSHLVSSTSTTRPGAGNLHLGQLGTYLEYRDCAVKWQMLMKPPQSLILLDFESCEWNRNVRLGSTLRTDTEESTCSGAESSKKQKTLRPISSATPHLADFVKADDEVTNRLFNTRNSQYFLPSGTSNFYSMQGFIFQPIC